MTERTRFKAWITKYALTKGIYEIEIEDCFDISSTMVKQVKPVNAPRYYTGACYHNNDWHRTRLQAEVRAEEMRMEKITSLRKQLALN